MDTSSCCPDTWEMGMWSAARYGRLQQRLHSGCSHHPRIALSSSQGSQPQGSHIYNRTCSWLLESLTVLDFCNVERQNILTLAICCHQTFSGPRHCWFKWGMGKGRRPNILVTSPSDKPGACKDRCKQSKQVPTNIDTGKKLTWASASCFSHRRGGDPVGCWPVGEKETSTWSSWTRRKGISISISLQLWRAEALFNCWTSIDNENLQLALDWKASPVLQWKYSISTCCCSVPDLALSCSALPQAELHCSGLWCSGLSWPNSLTQEAK